MPEGCTTPNGPRKTRDGVDTDAMVAGVAGVTGVAISMTNMLECRLSLRADSMG